LLLLRLQAESELSRVRTEEEKSQEKSRVSRRGFGGARGHKFASKSVSKAAARLLCTKAK